ncbi:hypothetical protein LCGC14_0519230 [marine sediment metagenome]|uniref:Uncharacterized protein n=1 Tax=marine sediment metagenome TaxID=412755 RepID=A0A0F9SHC6_9ZZZZ
MAPTLPRYGFNMLPSTTIGAAGTVTGIPIPLRDVKHLQVQAVFVRAAGGTDVKVFIQTSLDAGVTWIDIMNLRFTTSTATKVSAAHRDSPLAAAITPTDGSLTNDVVVNGLIGDRVRAKVVSTGTYTGVTTLAIEAVAHR